MIFKNRASWYMFGISLAVCILFPLVNIKFIYPLFTDLLVSNTEDEAVRLGSHLAGMYFKSNRPITAADIERLKNRVDDDIHHFNLMKLKLFSATGETIYSTDQKDIGKINNHSYFHDTVAQGRTFTKIVKKDTASLEGQKVTMDVVETYVPVMRDGKFLGAFEIYYDITDRREALSRVIFISSVIPLAIMLIYLVLITIVLRRQDNYITRIEQAEEELQRYADKLKKSNEELESFAYVASHDLQEPLRKVMAFGDRLFDKYADALDDRGRDYLNRMQSATRRMQTLIQGLLSFSRVTTKAKPFEPVNLSMVVSEVASDLEARVEETGGRIEVSDLPVIDADPLQMRQLLQNLVGNALKFRKKDTAPEIKIHAEAVTDDRGDPGEMYRIIVEDNGIGFDQKYTDRIFGVFQRLHGRQEYEGSGIGLSICKRIVERHNGTITAESVPGEGTRFIITMPAHQAKGGNDGNDQATTDHDING
jgi:signal transduction histidine kinase